MILSLLKSPTTNDIGFDPFPVNSVLFLSNTVCIYAMRTFTLLLKRQTTTISVRVSLLKSPSAIDRGEVPTGYFSWFAKEPLPSLKRTLTSLLIPLATAISNRLSLLKSPTVTDAGYDPTEYLISFANELSP